MQARILDRDKAIRTQPLTWADLIDHTPEQAAAVMEVVLGRRIFAIDAQSELARVKEQNQGLGSVGDTVADFKRCSMSKGTSTTRLHKLINYGSR